MFGCVLSDTQHIIAMSHFNLPCVHTFRLVINMKFLPEVQRKMKIFFQFLLLTPCLATRSQALLLAALIKFGNTLSV